MLQSYFRKSDQLIDAVFEDRVEQFFLGGESPVHRAHPDVGVTRHVVERRLDAFFGEQFPRGFEHTLPIALCVLTQ